MTMHTRISGVLVVQEVRNWGSNLILSCKNGSNVFIRNQVTNRFSVGSTNYPYADMNFQSQTKYPILQEQAASTEANKKYLLMKDATGNIRRVPSFDDA